MICILAAAAFAGPIVTENVGATTTASQDADYAYKTDVLEIRAPVRLLHVAPWVAYELGHSGPDFLYFVVYEETAPNVWELIWQSAPTPIGTTLDYHPSEEIDLRLQPGTRYSVGVYFPDGNYVYAYDFNGPPADYGWGEFGGAVWSSSDTTPTLPQVINQVPASTGYAMQVTVELLDGDFDGVETDEDCDDDDPTSYPGAPELCDQVDNDCNGSVDDQVVYVSWHADVDGDGFGDPANVLEVCDGSAPSGYTLDDQDCDDTAADVHPDGTELCDGRDGDCNGTVDDDPLTFTQYTDADGDGFGDPAAPVEICDGVIPAGLVPNDSDCNDASASSWPGAPEICDGDDNDCDGETDENQTFVTYYADTDGDGFGDPAAVVPSCDGQPAGAVSDRTDCDDGDADRFPGNEEVCDGKDNDCDSLSGGEGDFDGDGWLDCEDCRSDDPTTYPGAVELCDGQDHDCDGEVPDRLACDPEPGEPVAIGSGCGCSTGGPSGAWLALPLLALVAGRTRVR